ncbi:AAA family ATPase [Coraliomargarita sp. W4R72]
MNKKTKYPTRLILSGLAGSGKSSVGKALAEKLGYTFRSAGFYAREEARKRGITIQELQVQLESEPEFDLQLDDQLIHWGERNAGWVLDYRMGFALLPDVTSIYLTVDELEAARRIGDASRREEFNGQEQIDEIVASIHMRNQNMRTRLLRLYEEDFADQTNYDHVVSTDGKTIDDVVEQILELLS